ncbi:two-component system, HptB-dependent secretion and biofilm response regulator [Gammaproteobacteria bacterium]
MTLKLNKPKILMLKLNKPKILIVDDAVEDLQILMEGLRKDYSVVGAKSGEKALYLASLSPPPDLILLDVMMRGMDGLDVCRRLKSNHDTADIPVIFITALQDEWSEVEALNAGSVDFITKPINLMVFRARVKTHLALRMAYRELAASHAQMSWERELIEDILLAMREQPLLRESFVRTLLTPVERTNGDLFLLGRRPDGFIHAMVGDCTGHGLPAAIVGPMTMDVFHTMTEKGLSPEEILHEINRKLCRVPSNIFICGCFIELSPSLDSIRLWNGGLPDVLFLREREWFLVRPSSHLPLGIVPKLSMGNFHESVTMQPGDRVYSYSDGIVETLSPEGEMFGLERLKAFLGKMVREGEELDSLLPILNTFRGHEVSDDDITLVEFHTP